MDIVTPISLIGQTIGKYRLVSMLGAGGMAQVYQAIQLPLERLVAVKVLHPHLTTEDTFRERFLREAKAVASLSHPHIVQIYDYEFLDGVCYMAMEFLDGVSLEDRLRGLALQANRHTPLPLTEAIKIISEVAEALSFAHQHGVVHRDVKPANIMQTQDGRVVLTDFGIATVLHETRLTVDGGTSGTPSYMSPEQALGDRGDERSDIYSLGAVTYQLVTGQLPFESDTMYGLMMKQINDTPPPASSVNPQLPLAVEQVIGKAMVKDPAHRYQKVKEFAADLQAVAAGRPVKINLPTHTMTFLTKNKGKEGWLVVGLALLIGLLLTFLVNMRSSVEIQTWVANNEGVDSMAAAHSSNQEFFDDFSNNDQDWLISDSPISRQIVDGTYQITVEASSRAISAHPEHGGAYDNFVYQAEATLLAGQPESGYGLVFRRQDNDNYYVFAVNGLRQWSVWRLQDRVWLELRQLPEGETWTTAEAVLPAGQLNRLKVEATGPYLRFFVNDQALLEHELNDDAFASGGIGFYVASSRTADNPLAQVQFDHIALTSIPADAIPSMTSDGREK